MKRQGDAPERWLEHRSVWNEKSGLRAIYADFFARIEEWLAPGRTVELGCGSGNFKEFLPASVAFDIEFAPWLDVVADAHRLPLSTGAVANLVLVDVIHHLEEPRRFLEEAERALAPGGRLILVEPAVTTVSWFFYRFLHPERLDLAAEPLAADARTGAHPYEGNQAIATLLFDEQRGHLGEAAPRLKMKHKSFLSLFAYPLSGGFRRWSLVPRALAKPLLRLEDRLAPVLGRWIAFRMMVVLERVQ